MSKYARCFPRAFVPFPRWTWIHPHVPSDNFDYVCKVIWVRAKETEERFGRGQRTADNKRSHRTDEQQINTNDSNTQCEEETQQLQRSEFTLPGPYLSGHRQACVAKSSRAPSPVMEEKMKLNTEETESRGNLVKGEQRHVGNSDLCSETPESVDEPKMSNSRRSDHVMPPDVRSDAESASDTSNGQQTENSHKSVPPMSTRRNGLLPHPAKPPASGKLRGQWEIPLSFHPHNIPTDTLASGPAAPVQAPVQGRAEAPQATSKPIAPLAAQTQQGPYDLLADFPALQPPVRPLALCELRGGNPKTKDATGKRQIIQRRNHRQETEARYETRNGPHMVSSICASDQKSALNPQTSGSSSISCKDAGTDGAAVNARSWACAAKAGMKQAAAPQERARPCSFRQILTINRAKAVNQKHHQQRDSIIHHQSGSRSTGGGFMS